MWASLCISRSFSCLRKAHGSQKFSAATTVRFRLVLQTVEMPKHHLARNVVHQLGMLPPELHDMARPTKSMTTTTDTPPSDLTTN